MTTRVLVLCGGPGAEREVSVRGGAAIARALRASGRFDVTLHTLAPEFGAGAPEDALRELRAFDADVVWPFLHGPFGEGGPMQDILEALGSTYVGSRPAAARIAIDKVATKSVCASVDVLTTASCVLNPNDAACPLPFPVVVKPVFEGSTIGLHVCRDEARWRHAHAESARSGRPCMIEPFVRGREVTVGMIERDGALVTLPLIEIAPADGLYDYEAKYNRDDTRYTVGPDLPGRAAEEMREASLRIARAIGVRHLARTDFIVGEDGSPRFLEINTMPGFTDHSLVPMAARAAGLEMPALCASLVDAAAALRH